MNRCAGAALVGGEAGVSDFFIALVESYRRSLEDWEVSFIGSRMATLKQGKMIQFLNPEEFGLGLKNVYGYAEGKKIVEENFERRPAICGMALASWDSFWVAFALGNRPWSLGQTNWEQYSHYLQKCGEIDEDDQI